MDSPQKSRAPLLPLALVAMGALALQVALTRVFSLLIWYHFAFLTIALALLGFAAGGRRAERVLRESGDDPRIVLARLATGFSASTVLALLVAANLPFRQSVLADPIQFACFVILVGVVAVPFVLVGTLIATVLVHWRADAGRLYFADLAGSGIGCALVVPALDHLGGGAAGVLLSGALGALGALGFAWQAPGPGRRRQRLLAAGALALSVGGLALAHDPLRRPFYLPNAKIFPQIDRALILTRRCTSVACVDVFDDRGHFGAWGLPAAYTGPKPDQVGYSIDAWALTSTYRATRNASGAVDWQHPVFEWLPASLVHLVRRGVQAPPAQMFVIGAGGGPDLRAGLHFGAAQIEAVDINPTIVSYVRNELADYSGGLYADPRVHVSIGEGRSALRRSAHAFDVIQISGVDTYAASQAGAFALSENYLYTTEALHEYLAHLTDDGILTFTRWLYRPERQTLRLGVIADRALREAGVADPSRNVVIVGVPTGVPDLAFSVVLVRRTPFPPEMIRAVQRESARLGSVILWAPGMEVPDTEFRRFFTARDKDAFVDAYPYRIEATTDDTPFFFEHNRFARLLESRDVIFQSANGQMVLVVTLVLVLASAWLLLRRRPGETPAALGPAWSTYFTCLGFGYIAVETVLVPRFVLYLGHPAHALSVVLFALLLSSGVGSALSTRLVRGDLRRLAVACGVIALTLLAFQAVTPGIFSSTLHASQGVRVAIAIALLAVPGTMMGVAFPSGIAQAPADETGGPWVARAWVLNGWSSVVGTVLAMIVAIAGGFTVVLAGAALCYGIAAACAFGSRGRSVTAG